MYRMTVIMLVLFTIIFGGCSAGPKLSQVQIRQITTSLISGTYEETYHSVLTVFKDLGCRLKSEDMARGLIIAQVARAGTGSSQFFQALFSEYVPEKFADVEIRCALSKLSNSETEIRIHIQETSTGSRSSKGKIKPIYDAALYGNLFFEMELAVKRRQTITGKSNPNVASLGVGAGIPMQTAPSHSQQKFESTTVQGQKLYFNIRKIVRSHVLIHSDNPDDFDMGTTYKILSGTAASEVEIGGAKVVLKKGSTIALQVIRSSGPIRINDKIKYNR